MRVTIFRGFCLTGPRGVPMVHSENCSVSLTVSPRYFMRGVVMLANFAQFITYPWRLIGFLVTYPIRVIFGVDFDWGIR